MKKYLSLIYLAFINIQAFEYEVQFENDQVCVSKVVVEGKEEIGLHRDALPRVVIALKGGTITRLESNGEKVDVHFPKGKAIYLLADLENELHKGVNNSDEPIEVITIQLKK